MQRLDEAQLAIASLRSSPALRCVQTVEPLQRRAKCAIEIDPHLMEGSEIPLPLPRDAAAGAHICCAHGDNIPWLLDRLRIDWDDRCRKGSIWFIARDGRGKITGAEYEKGRKE